MTSSAMVRLEAVEAARRRPGGSAAATLSALSRTTTAQPRNTSSTCHWGLQEPGRCCDPRATWRRAARAPVAILHTYVARASRDLLDTIRNSPCRTRGAE